MVHVCNCSFAQVCWFLRTASQMRDVVNMVILFLRTTRKVYIIWRRKHRLLKCPITWKKCQKEIVSIFVLVFQSVCCFVGFFFWWVECIEYLMDIIYTFFHIVQKAVNCHDAGYTCRSHSFVKKKKIIIIRISHF